MEHKVKQFELVWGEPEALALVRQKALDGERIAQERQRKEDEKKQAEQKRKPVICQTT